ncbi:hypothetical protein Ptr902_07381 [Pyrenophora tritici-repentis]|uniref:Uncharacterized protein n=1 Tax=Pyrenophora tritici-repentis TaxID=45151 RepID=A0A5M9KQ10_9PLEO|nr:hypothetical protein PtrV1_13704 [Pyrenophora tritici-repentis]KAF7447269.1 hypothetical protein A1F99_087160 [Pyrenophora tritici-repentis]KAF7569625.1 hypothetical protein PtrM4_120400 [Pyrenophora tritici-repentis]KAI0572772.1 hypothetical protein Alg130_10362 [Pyrenophora tritici-repentis]KAI0573481.1 hypothetical protein Alg215_09162 [Pyrenophora tritici-repentis]
MFALAAVKHSAAQVKCAATQRNTCRLVLSATLKAVARLSTATTNYKITLLKATETVTRNATRFPRSSAHSSAATGPSTTWGSVLTMPRTITEASTFWVFNLMYWNEWHRVHCIADEVSFLV